MTEKAFVKEGYCWQALDKARCGNWDKNKKLEKTQKVIKTRKLFFVVSAVYMTAKRLFLKGGKH